MNGSALIHLPTSVPLTLLCLTPLSLSFLSVAHMYLHPSRTQVFMIIGTQVTKHVQCNRTILPTVVT